MKKISFVICMTALFIYSNCKHIEKEEAEEIHFLVTSPVVLDTIIYNEYVCQIHSFQHIELKALEKGYLQNVYVDEGKMVRKGQLLFQIMPLIYQAEMKKAQAEVEFVEIEYINTKKLADSNIVSSSELALAKAHLDKAKAELSLAQVHLGFTQINAPFDGIVGRFHVRLGSLIEEGELLTTLSDNSKMWVYFNVPESEYLDHAVNSKSDYPTQVKLRMANNQEFDHTGIVETIEADFNNETGNIAFRATFKNPKAILRHGETGSILMPIALKNAVIVPQKTTFEVLDKKFIYVIDENDMVRSRLITVSKELPHLYVINSGVGIKDKILLDGLSKVHENQKLQYEFVNPQKAISDLSHLHAE
ncbi:MAG: efflux RND transporter periplasmic adaptor subunit [Saprospiraceae bacterium]|nr:efflux RND transporter periplasmic adaptor subunit [Saprospiraceae bacterium]